MENIETLKEWMKTHTNLSSSTIDLYCSVAGRFYKDYSHQGGLTAENINDFVSRNFRNRRNYYYKYVFKYLLAMENRVNDYNDVVKPRVERSKKRPGLYLSIEQLRAIIGRISNDKMKLAAKIDLITGLRSCEVLKLRWKDILPNGDINVMDVKTHSGRMLKIPESLAADILKLKGEKKNDAFIFWDTPIKYHSLYVKYLNNIKRASEGITPIPMQTHDFRRNFAMAAARVYTGDPRAGEIVQSLMGHSSYETTKKYFDDVKVDKEKLIKNLYQD